MHAAPFTSLHPQSRSDPATAVARTPSQSGSMRSTRHGEKVQHDGKLDIRTRMCFSGRVNVILNLVGTGSAYVVVGFCSSSVRCASITERRRRTRITPASRIATNAASTRSCAESVAPSGPVVGMIESKSTRKNTPADAGTKLSSRRRRRHQREDTVREK